MIVLEATAVHESGRLTAHTLAGYQPEIVAGYRRVVEAVRPHGTRLFVQLFHGGRELIASPPRPAAVAPSAVPSQRFHVEPRALTSAEIDEIVAGYARSAELAAEGGLDGIELSAAHGYLFAQFFTPGLNLREDEWATGPQLLIAVVETVRNAAPGLALGVRLSADSEAAVAVAPELAGLVDYLSIALGDSSTYRGSTGIVPPPPVEESAIAGFAAPFRVGPPADRDVAHRRPGRSRPAHRGRSRRRSRDDACAHHGPRPSAQGRATGRPTTSSAASAATPASRTTTPRSRSRALRILGPDAS